MVAAVLHDFTGKGTVINSAGHPGRDVEVFDENGARKSMSGASTRLALEWTGLRDITGNNFSRTSEDTGQFTWTDEAAGKGTWIFKASESAKSVGDYSVALWYYDSSDATTPILLATAHGKVEAAPSAVPS